MKYKMTTHAHEGELAVFLIGMTVSKPWRVDQWGYLAAAMTKMLTELERNKAATKAEGADWLGYLGGYTTIGSKGPVVIQYWRSAEDIYRYANAPDRAHKPAWVELYRRAHRSKTLGVGLWHETYQVAAGAHESAYGNLPNFGLARATGSIPMARRAKSARDRMTALGR